MVAPPSSTTASTTGSSTLDDCALIVLPGHDYGTTPTSTIGRERQENYTLQPRTLDEFLKFMRE